MIREEQWNLYAILCTCNLQDNSTAGIWEMNLDKDDELRSLRSLHVVY